MKVPISWLKDYVDITLSVEELAERLTVAGLEVGHITYLGIPQGAPPEGSTQSPSDHLVWDREKIVLAAIHEVKPHPNADRLVLAMVDYGGDELEQCVTGAPNLYEYKGAGPLDPPLLTGFAREGAEVYDGHATDGSRMILKERALRGVPNRSMVLSEKELGISDSHEGIMLLDRASFGQYAPGTPLQDVLGDAILDIDILPNIARAYSIVGVAREVAALSGQTLRFPSMEVVMNGPSLDGKIAIDIHEPELNPRFTVGLIRDIEIKPAPEWMQRRLKLAGMRPINNIVDATNYVMLELGQPLHAFDYDTLIERANGEMPTIITRLPEPGETLVTLDGEKHDLDDYNMLVADTAGALSIAGVMGGLESEINSPNGTPIDATGVQVAQDDEAESLPRGKASTTRPVTQNVLLEAANWNFINIRRTMQSQKMSSEAGMRFSRGVHPAMAILGLKRCLELMRITSGGIVAQGIVDEYPLVPETLVIDLPVSEVTRLLGFAIPEEEIVRILRTLEFEVEEQGEMLRVTVPDHRTDVGSGLTGRADLIEEIVRIYGYDRVPTTIIADALPAQRANLPLVREEQVRDALTKAGFREIVTYRLTTPEREALLTPQGQPSYWPDVPYVTLANPISSDKTVMRHTLLSGLMDVAAANARHTDRQRLFEVGRVYLPVEEQKLPDEPVHIGLLMLGPRDEPNWQHHGDRGVVDFFDLKGVVEALLDDMRVGGTVRYTPTEHSSFHPGRAAALDINGRYVGVLGEIHPLVREAYGFGMDLQRPILGAELDLMALVATVTTLRDIRPVPTQPAVYQDIALIVDEDLPAADVHAAILSTGGALLEAATLFDVYRGDPIPAGKKSLAFSLTYRAPDRTLTDKEVAAAHAKIVKAAEKRLGAQLRA
ncbi:MAG TPA: phenylalanine--tRNA ligase subunit beta [Aggregatilinea sp.]|uniref:phenylalanine--tRNA ligase subunit beta n=1 Tax=Aggregatilinea sp. TaxID=2806333 RepID=UPI002CD70E19|nr:phenylalanine--tRNA ligase subunit beta [Aggregatilinea sp.]HML22917.1 phenylalanine--tRNA ligase subunit beta [Aggregatilinea sp.]